MLTQTVMNDNGVELRETSTPSRYLPAIARILMGLVFFVFGLNGFVPFIPMPKTPPPPGALALFEAFLKTGYFMHMVSGTQLLVGVLLLANRFVPLALALIAPVIVNIIAYHVFLAPASIGPGIVVTVLEVYLAWAYRDAFGPMLSARTLPTE